MTILRNAVLARYQGGHIYVDRSGGSNRREAFLDLGGIVHEETARGLCNRLLDQYATQRRTVAMEGPILAGDDAPGPAYTIGDRIAGDLITSVTVSLGDDGLATSVPTLNDEWDANMRALERQIARAGAGLVSEYARPTINRPDTGESTDTSPPEFSLDGPVTVTFSPAWRAIRPWWGAWLDVGVEVPGSTATRVVVARPNGSLWLAVADAVIPAGERRGLGRINRGWAVGQRLVLIVTTAGVGAAKLTASLRGTVV